MATTSIWDDDIRQDMDDIGWNPFNSDESLVLGANKVSFYKGVTVFLKNSGRSGSFYAIILNRGLMLMNLDMNGVTIGKL